MQKYFQKFDEYKIGKASQRQGKDLKQPTGIPRAKTIYLIKKWQIFYPFRYSTKSRSSINSYNLCIGYCKHSSDSSCNSWYQVAKKISKFQPSGWTRIRSRHSTILLRYTIMTFSIYITLYIFFFKFQNWKWRIFQLFKKD